MDLGLFAEGTVQGGRHPEGADIEEIYGMQEPTDNYLAGYFDVVNLVVTRTRRVPFFVPLGLNGSFRIQQSPENTEKDGKPKPTAAGIRSLIRCILGLKPDVWIEAKLGLPFGEEDVTVSVGSDWRDNKDGSNAFFMRRLLALLPPAAWGDYGRRLASETPVELISPS